MTYTAASAVGASVAKLNGLFKVVYAKEIVNAIPDFAVLQKRIQFSQAEKLGNYFAQPVNLSSEGGFTYIGEAGNIVDLTQPQAGVMKEAQIKGSEINLRGWISFKAAAASLGGGEKAFKRATAVKVLDMNNSMRKRLEIAMIYGQVGVATVSAVTDSGGGVCVATISDATWAPGIWSGTEGHLLDSFTSTTLNNAAGPITITSVDMDNKKLTLTTQGATSTDEVAVSDVLYFAGAYAGSTTWTEMAGLQKIITNTTTLFNIDANAYSLWKGNSVGTVGEPSLAKIQDAVAKAVNRGLMSKALVLLPTKAWAVLNSNEAALRMYDSSFGGGTEGKNGFKGLTYYAANGELELLPHPMVKEGDAFIVPEESLVRVGATDVTFSLDGEQFFRFVQDKNAFELQCMADQAIFLEKPAHAVYLSGLTYT